jgi:hypothetical protein
MLSPLHLPCRGSKRWLAAQQARPTVKTCRCSVRFVAPCLFHAMRCPRGLGPEGMLPSKALLAQPHTTTAPECPTGFPIGLHFSPRRYRRHRRGRRGSPAGHHRHPYKPCRPWRARQQQAASAHRGNQSTRLRDVTDVEGRPAASPQLCWVLTIAVGGQQLVDGKGTAAAAPVVVDGANGSGAAEL